MKIINECVTQRKTAVITGATAGIGLETARILVGDGYHIVAVGRDEKALLSVVRELGKKRVTAVSADLRSEKECAEVYRLSSRYTVTVLINCAGVGVYGEFIRSGLKKEMDMLDLNVRACHILTKLFARRFCHIGHGNIVNVASAAGFMPGPFMTGYYAGKSYVVSLSAGIRAELERKHRNVHISVFCPGPVSTDFNKRAGIKGAVKGITPEEAARELVRGMERNEAVIIPSFAMKVFCTLGRAVPLMVSSTVNYYVQSMKKPL